jgi:hypothetical protein
VDDFYIQFDEEFPMEANYEDEFNVGINLARSLITSSNQAVFKSKGNFYSLFGVCIDYFRKTQRNQFSKYMEIEAKISDLVNRAKMNDFDVNNPDIQNYSDVSTRSTSDKSRRAERERILLSIVREVEGF